MNNSLEDTSNPKVTKPKPPAPLDQIIHDLVDGFQEAINSNNVSGIKLALNQLILSGNTSTDFLKYNRTELTSLQITAKKIISSTTQPPPYPTTQQTHQLPQLPKPQTIGLKTPRMENP